MASHRTCSRGVRRREGRDPHLLRGLSAPASRDRSAVR
jgi:hypothetical protein